MLYHRNPALHIYVMILSHAAFTACRESRSSSQGKGPNFIVPPHQGPSLLTGPYTPSATNFRMNALSSVLWCLQPGL